MELSKKGDFCLENKRDEEQMSYPNSSLPSEWQFSHQQVNSSIMDSFSSDWSSAILPSRFAHLSSDSGFNERAAMFSCFTGGNNLGALINDTCTANEPLSQMTDHRDEKGSKNEPQEEATNSSSGGTGAKKRKRSNMDVELNQAQGAIKAMKENLESNAKCSNKNAKDCLEAPKENYIHVRARRGQATNSHSLAERVRRERISERMKLLQDLVPGCSKVTGKAVMLDEIINYVQSLQRQVEFLSMKLAAVNPRTDLNIEGLLSKDLLQLCGGSSSSMGFSLDMIHSQLHPGVVNSSDAFRRMINAQLSSANEYKEHAPQMQRSWEDELHNALQMNFGFNPSLNIQESNDRHREGYPI